MNKYRVIASVHEGAIWEQRFKELEQAIERAYSIVDANASVNVVWQRIPPGQAYLAGEPSTTSTVVPPVPVNIKQETREQFMHAICQQWMMITGCSVNEVIVNAMNEDVVGQYMQMSQARLSQSKAKSRFTLMFIGALLKKWFRGYTSFNVNLKS